MIRNIFTLSLIGMLVSDLTLYAQTASSKHEGEIKRRIIELGVDQMVTAKLYSKEKIEGRITKITDDHVAVQIVKNSNFSEQKLRFGEVKSINRKVNRSAFLRSSHGQATMFAIAFTLFILIAMETGLIKDS